MSSNRKLSFLRRYVAIPALFVMIALPPALLGGCQVKQCGQDKPQVDPLALPFGTPAKPINITVWYMFEDPGVMTNLKTQYESRHPYTTITPRQFTSRDEYFDQLSKKIGSDQAPDVFILLHDWLPLRKGQLAPMTSINLQRTPDPFTDVRDYARLFFPALETEWIVTKPGKTAADTPTYELYGVPWGFEGTTLLVNREQWSDYNSANPSAQLLDVPLQATKPMTWNQFFNAAQRLIMTKEGWVRVSTDANRPTTIDPSTVVRYGAALGYGNPGPESNVQHSSDIFTAMLMQNDVDIVSEDQKTAAFISAENATNAYTQLNYYAKFAQLWGSPQEGWASSVESFAKNKVTMAFARSYQLSGIPSTVKYEAVPFPQRSSDDKSTWVTPAYYWVRVVNRTSPNVSVAWDFVKFVASKDIMKTYSENTGLPPARQDLIEEVNYRDPKLKVFALGMPYAQSYYKGNWETADQIFSDAINDVAYRRKDAQAALTTAATKMEKNLENYQLYPSN